MRCLGYKTGTDCKRVVRTHRHTPSWQKYQLCSGCAKSDKTMQYRGMIDSMTSITIGNAIDSTTGSTMDITVGSTIGNAYNS